MRKLVSLLAACFAPLGCNVGDDAKPTGSKVLGKNTTEIVKFNADDPTQKVSKAEINYTNPITGAIDNYGPILERAVLPQVNHAIDLFHAMNGRYPKDYDEFMSGVIKTPEGTIKLPVLPGDKKYAYDAKNHQLIVVEKNGPSP